MAKKIAEVPLSKGNFLDGYKPVTPNFATEPEVEKDEIPDSKPATPPPKAKSGSTYQELFLTQSSPEQKTYKLGISKKHFEMLEALVTRLSTPELPLSKVGYLWNVLEQHFNTYGKTIKELINKTPPSNPFDNFK